MPSQHKHAAISFRPPVALRERLMAFAADTGTPVNAVVTEAVETFLAAQGGATTRPPAKGSGTTTRRPARRAAPVAAELARERARDQRDDDAPVCLHRVPPGAYCTRCGRITPERGTAPKGERK